jgi:hypothetical protein
MPRKKSVVEKTAKNRLIVQKSSPAAFISEIHALNKTSGVIDEEKIVVTKKVDDPSLIRVYQRLSSRGQTRGFNNTAKWLVKHLPKANRKIEMLDVGAVQRDSYSRYSKWITCNPIDIQPLMPGIEKADLLTYKPSITLDIVNLSLVLNFSGCPWQRGNMLVKAHNLVSHPDSMGLIYIVLPRATVCNSRYFDKSQLKEDIMGKRGLDMELVQEHFSPKLYYSLWRTRKDSSNTDSSLPSKKIQLKIGDSRKKNNFCILFRPQKTVVS